MLLLLMRQMFLLCLQSRSQQGRYTKGCCQNANHFLFHNNLLLFYVIMLSLYYAKLIGILPYSGTACQPAPVK